MCPGFRQEWVLQPLGEGLPEEPRKSQLITARVRPRTAVSHSVSLNFIRAPLLATCWISAKFSVSHFCSNNQ